MDSETDRPKSSSRPTQLSPKVVLKIKKGSEKVNNKDGLQATLMTSIYHILYSNQIYDRLKQYLVIKRKRTISDRFEFALKKNR